jgi:hypothetical protein
MKPGRNRMQLAVAILFMAGSTCFFIGTALSLWQELTR